MDPITAQQIQNLLAQADKIEAQGPLNDPYTPTALREKARILLGAPKGGVTTGPQPTSKPDRKGMTDWAILWLKNLFGS